MRVGIGEGTWPYGRFLEDLRKAGERLRQAAEFYKDMFGAASNGKELTPPDRSEA